MKIARVVGGVLRPFLSLLACHGGKGREKGDKKRQKGTKKVNLFGKVQADRPHL